MSRYFRRETGINDSEQYRDAFEKRGRKNIKQYRTPTFRIYEAGVLESVETYNYIFQKGDTYWKIANIVYGDPTFWWVVAAFNRVPTLSHLRAGDVVKVPIDLANAIEALE